MKQLGKNRRVSENVVFVGSVTDNDRTGYYAACDVFVMPNRQIGADVEGFGIVLLEAGAVGKPVTGGRSGGTAEAIQDGVTGVRIDGGVETCRGHMRTGLRQDRNRSLIIP